MTRGEKVFITLAAVALILLVVFGVWFNTPAGRGIINTYFHKVQEVDDLTRYETKKEVEDSCRAMISSYESDKLVYEQYKDSESAEKQSWAEQAKMRANKTASTYNNYVLKNNYVWAGNVPGDIKANLEYIE